jgi:hypothetical protein
MLKARSADRSRSSTISGDQEGTDVESQFAEPLIESTPQSGIESAFTQFIQRHLRTRRGLFMHGFLFAVVAVDLFILYALTDRGASWTIWPIGVWAILLAAQTGFSTVKPGFFGMHLVGGAAICIGLAIINIFHGRDDASGGGWWVIWPILAWLISLVIHLPFAYDLITLNDLHRKTPVRPQDP